MNLHALRIFVEVATQKSVTRAAAQLVLTQPAVTAQVRNLEKELGLALLAPSGRGVRLTEAGELLFQESKRLFQMERNIETRLANLKAGHLGTLRVVASNLPANRLLPKWLAQFKQAYPDVDADLQTTNSRAALESLLAYRADVAVVGGDVQVPGVSSEPISEEEQWFVVPPTHQLTGREVSLHEMVRVPFIAREDGSTTRDQLFALCHAAHVPPPQIGLQFHGINESIQAVMAGYGAMLVPSLAVRDEIDRGILGRVLVQGVDLRVVISICTRNDGALSPVARHFVEMVHAIMREMV